METPVSSRRRGPRWLLPTKKLDIGASPVRDSSPASSSRDADSTFSPATPSAELQRQMIDFEDEYDEVMPCTQNFHAGREVFWNYEASPKTRDELRRKMAETDSKEEKKKKRSQPKPVTPVIKLRTTSTRSSIEDPYNDENFLYLAGIAESIVEKDKNSTQTSSPALQPTTPQSEKSLVEVKSEAADEDPFDKDDSFFVECSQALDDDEIRSRRSLDSNSNHTFKVPEVKRIASPQMPNATSSTAATSTNAKLSTVKSTSTVTSKSSTAATSTNSKLPTPKSSTPKSSTPKSSTATSSTKAESSSTNDNFFDDDDGGEFEMMLSQIELPTAARTTTTSTTAYRSTVSVPQPKPVLAQPEGQNSKGNANLFKRFKSADDVVQRPVTRSSAQTTPTTTVATAINVPHQATNTRTVTSSFRRVNTLPETPPGPLPGGRQTLSTVTTSRCSKEEIERKRQEALKRRQMNSQKHVEPKKF